ncbi:hypothetical protein IAD21_01850 [Abditibacteriota bacterium]|nr:hypothetical protein IAD21_01850 [Abditibacteriota bacterium]
MPRQLFELWRSEDGGQDSFFPSSISTEERAKQLSPDSKLIWTTEAESWNEAQQNRYDFMGWGHYRTMEEED